MISAAPSFGWAGLSAVAGAAAVVVALLAFIGQLRALRRTLSSQTYQQMALQFNEIQRFMAQRPDIYRALFLDEPSPTIRGSRHEVEVNWTLGVLFNWYESAAMQCDVFKIVPRDMAKHWRTMLAHELSAPAIDEYWRNYGHHFHPVLRAWAAKALHDLETGQAAVRVHT